MDMSGHPQPKIEKFHQARSSAIDAFADLESALLDRLRAANIPIGCQLFGQRIDLASKNLATLNQAISGPALTQELLDTCRLLAELRNDMVHCAMKRTIIDGKAHVGFASAAECPVSSRKVRYLTLEQLKATKNECDRASAAFRLG